MVKTSSVFNPVLTGVLVEQFAQAESEFIAPRLAPVFKTGVIAAQYPVFTRENLVSVPALKPRKAGTEYPRIHIELSDDTFSCVDRGIESPVDDDERKKYANQFDADSAAVRRIARTILVNWEMRTKGKIDAAVSAGAVAKAAAPAVKWDAAANTTILKNVNAARTAFRKQCGMKPNTMTISDTVFNALKESAEIIDKIKYTSRGVVTLEMLAGLFEIPNIVIAGGLNNTATEGQPISVGDIWGDDIIMSFSQQANDLNAPNFMRTFNWNGGDGIAGSKIETYRQDNIKSDVHRANHFTDEKITGAMYAYVIPDVLT